MAVWEAELPVTSKKLMNELGGEKKWKAATIISFLNRLEERGYLMSYKDGKERSYIPVAERELYISSATNRFCEKLHEGSFVGLLDALFYDRSFTEKDIDDLSTWLRERFDG